MLRHGKKKQKPKQACEIPQRPKTSLRRTSPSLWVWGGERAGRRRMVQRGLSWKGFSARPAAAFASLPPWLLSASGVAAARPSRGCAYITARRVLLPRALGSRGRGAPRDRDAAGTSATGPRPAGQAEEREPRREEGAGGGGGEGRPTTPPAMMPGQIPDPSVTAGSLPGLGPLTGLPSSALTTEELKYADIRNIGAMIAPLHFLEVKLGKRPQPVKSELDEDEERRKRRREKNKVAAARCRNKKKERTEFLQRESERLELMNAELKTQIEELKLERQQLILMLNRHRPTCIVRTDSVRTPESEGNPLLEQLDKK
ncbi:LOW QUALITY PROTEIN: jun dimerization protein 2 [Peromyscus californicus insignis]|uniref:LOW QUALITY PROTEIN: jun dimerization protein 2 n=1 Tax=Peromyscus californicus insignis TaxID=564181 RepID=UPI0022A6741B|nr:LOW QUALITY PROTEIN: jun dimerization protein 2 [Peromyscus californicus insignis]